MTDEEPEDLVARITDEYGDLLNECAVTLSICRDVSEIDECDFIAASTIIARTAQWLERTTKPDAHDDYGCFLIGALQLAKMYWSNFTMFHALKKIAATADPKIAEFAQSTLDGVEEEVKRAEEQNDADTE